MAESAKLHSKAILVLVVIAIVMGLGVWLSYYLSPQGRLEKVGAIVVISGGQTTTRAQHGIELYQQGYAPTIIFSGAAMDDGPSNARQMREQALKNGVPRSAIKVDEQAQNTYENAINTKKIIEQNNIKSIILVTSPYHQRRAELTFKHILGADLAIIDSSSYDSRWSKAGWWSNLFGWRITLSEAFKILYIKISGSYQ